MSNLQTIFNTKSTVEVISSSGEKHIVVLCGGMSSERYVSLDSAKSIISALVKSGYRVTKVDPGADVGATIHQLAPDVVFNTLHGTYGEDGCIPGLLNMMRIPYTHSGLQASCVAFDKLLMRKLFAANNNVTLIPAKVVRKSDLISADPMPRPYVIKPLAQGSSVGVEIIFEGDAFNFADYSFPYGEQIIVEKYIKAREIQVAVLNGKALGALEIQVLKGRFYDYQAKYTQGYAKHLMPAALLEAQTNKVLQMAQYVYNDIGCNGIARVEFLFDQQADIFYFLEINTHPGMTSLSLCPEIADYVGISFEELVAQILATAKYEI
jgi:D-alanine-D-alanine ligase